MYVFIYSLLLANCCLDICLYFKHKLNTIYVIANASLWSGVILAAAGLTVYYAMYHISIITAAVQSRQEFEDFGHFITRRSTMLPRKVYTAAAEFTLESATLESFGVDGLEAIDIWRHIMYPLIAAILGCVAS